MKAKGREKHWVVVAFVVIVFILGACGNGGSTPTGGTDGKALLENRCAQCHNLGRVTSKQKTHEQWDQTVTRMIETGATLSADEKTVLVDYLAETYGP